MALTASSNGAEEIEWRVLDKQGSRVLVIRRYALDCQPYNTENEAVTWETCSLRQWLNEEIADAAFSRKEKSVIPTVTLSADANQSHNTDPGQATQDKLFLLSISEINKYFDSGSDRQCKPTASAVKNGVYSPDGNCWWCSRTPGIEQNYAAGVYFHGNIEHKAYCVDTEFNAVRPAMWIDLSGI